MTSFRNGPQFDVDFRGAGHKLHFHVVGKVTRRFDGDEVGAWSKLLGLFREQLRRAQEGMTRLDGGGLGHRDNLQLRRFFAKALESTRTQKEA